MLEAVGEGAPGAHDERRSPSVVAEHPVALRGRQALEAVAVGELVVPACLQRISQGVGDRVHDAVDVAQPEPVAPRGALAGPELIGQIAREIPGQHVEVVRAAGAPARAVGDRAV